MTVNSMQCCGFRELDELEYANPTEAITAFCGKFNRTTYNMSTGHTTTLSFACSHVVFTEIIGDGGYGRKLASYIKKHKLGTVVASPIGTNPNTHNRLRGYIWVINPTALKAWFKRR